MTRRRRRGSVFWTIETASFRAETTVSLDFKVCHGISRGCRLQEGNIYLGDFMLEEIRRRERIIAAD